MFWTWYPDKLHCSSDRQNFLVSYIYCEPNHFDARLICEKCMLIFIESGDNWGEDKRFKDPRSGRHWYRFVEKGGSGNNRGPGGDSCSKLRQMIYPEVTGEVDHV